SIRPGTGMRTFDRRLGSMPTRAGATTSSCRRSVISTAPTRIWRSCAESGAMTISPVSAARTTAERSAFWLTSDEASRQAATARARATSISVRTSALQRPAHRRLQLIDRRPVVAQRPHVLQHGVAIGPLRVEQVQHAEAAAAVGVLHRLAGALRARKINL